MVLQVCGHQRRLWLTTACSTYMTSGITELYTYLLLHSPSLSLFLLVTHTLANNTSFLLSLLSVTASSFASLHNETIEREIVHSICAFGLMVWVGLKFLSVCSA